MGAFDWLMHAAAGVVFSGMELKSGLSSLAGVMPAVAIMVLSGLGAANDFDLGMSFRDAFLTAVGMAVVMIGIVFFKEPAFFWRLFFIFLLIGSIIGLKAVSN